MQPYTNQTAFDIAAVALLTQNEQSLTDDGNTCAYRGADDLKCAIGHLIPDDTYNEQVSEGLGVMEMLKGAPKIALMFDECDAEFLIDLQNVHDDNEPHHWAKQLLDLAVQYELDGSCISRFKNAN